MKRGDRVKFKDKEYFLEAKMGDKSWEQQCPSWKLLHINGKLSTLIVSEDKLEAIEVKI